MKQARNSSDCFSILLVTLEDISKEILTLDALKATQRNNNPTKIIKEIFFYFYFFFKKTLITLLKQYLSR